MRRRKRNPFVKVGILCLSLILALGLLNVSYALWSQTLYMEGTVTTGQWDEGGTPGFWKNWDSHNTYSQGDIEGWLSGIIGSGWFDFAPATVEGMEAIFDAGEGGSPKSRFLRAYLATRLDVASGRLNGATLHDFSGIDPGGYLGLSGYNTVPAIIGAIESKAGSPPPNANQYELMKDVCDALNNLGI